MRRRLARVTVDVLLPHHYDGMDLADVQVDMVRVGLGASQLEFEELTDFVQASVVEVRVVMVDAE